MAKELYVGHLSESVTEEELRKLFSVMGTVTSIHLIIDPETREFKRCGYVRMAADVDPKEVAETLDGAYLIDQTITVSIARPQKPGMSGKGGGAKKPWLKAGPKPAGKKKSGPPAKASAPAAPSGTPARTGRPDRPTGGGRSGGTSGKGPRSPR